MTKKLDAIIKDALKERKTVGKASGRWTRGGKRGRSRGRGRGRGRSRGRRGRGRARGRGRGRRRGGKRLNDDWEHDLFYNSNKKLSTGRRGRGRNINTTKRLSIQTKTFTTKNGLEVKGGNDINTSIRVSGLHGNVSIDDIREIFQKYGAILYSYLINRPDGTPSGTARVCYSTPKEAMVASISLEGATIDGVPVQVTFLGNENNPMYRRLEREKNNEGNNKASQVKSKPKRSGISKMDVEEDEDDDGYQKRRAGRRKGPVGKNPPEIAFNPLSRE